MRNSKLAFVIVLVLVSITLPQVHAQVGSVTVTVTPTSQAVPQSSVATYTVTVDDGGLPGAVMFALNVAGISSGAASFSPNPVTVMGTGTSTLTIDTSGNSALYCPNTYQFTVTATGPSSSGTSSVTALSVTQNGAPLSVTVSTDKPSYTLGQPVTIVLSVNRQAKGTLTISPPSGPPQTFTYTFNSATSFPKTFSTANQPIGRWTVTFQADDYCSGFGSGSSNFDVTPNTYDVSISLSNVPSSVTVNIQVDGLNQGSMTGSDIKTLSFKIGSQHSISIDQYVQGDQGVRYYSAQNTWTVSSAGTHTFDYQIQYFFTVATDPDGIATMSGGGWNNAGTNVQTSTAPQIINGSAGSRYMFKGWIVDGVPQPVNVNPISLSLDKPHKIIAKYQIQYQLIMDSPNGLGNPQGAGYYDAGSTAQFGVNSPTGFLVQQVFVQWQGDYSGTSPKGSIVMDKQHIVHATWTTSYTQLYMVAAALVIILVAALLFWRRRSGRALQTKPTPPAGAEPAPLSEDKSGEDHSESITCNSCGTKMQAGTLHCTNCGAQLS